MRSCNVFSIVVMVASVAWLAWLMYWPTTNPTFPYGGPYRDPKE